MTRQYWRDAIIGAVLAGAAAGVLVASWLFTVFLLIRR